MISNQFLKSYFFIYLKSGLVSTVLTTLVFFFQDSIPDNQDFSVGFLWFAASLPGIMGFVLFMIYLSQTGERNAIMSGPQLYSAEFSSKDWNLFVQFLKTENKDSYWFNLLGFVVAGVLASLLRLIPVSLIAGASFGILLGLTGLAFKYIYISLLGEVKSDKERCVHLTNEGVLYGPHHIKWTKSNGVVESLKEYSLSDELSCIQLSYSKTAYSKGVGSSVQTKEVYFPVYKKDAETVMNQLLPKQTN